MPITFHHPTGSSLYARFDNAANTAVNFTEGSSLNVGLYTASDAAITTASLPARATPYSGRIFIGTAGAQANTDTQVGTFSDFYWAGTAEGGLTSVVGRKLVKYDGAPVGNLKTTFTRNVATVDAAGLGVVANQRRFSNKKHSVAGLIDWRFSGLDCGTNANLLASGPDLDGTPLLIYKDNTQASLKVAVIDDTAQSVKLVSTTLFSALAGTGGGTTYSPQAARIIYGTIVVLSTRTLTGPIYEGVTLHYSQDRGATWTRVENASGGTFDVPKPTAYSTNLDANPVGREWCLSIFPEGGMDAAGNFDKNDFWVTWTDYRVNPGAVVPKGQQYGTFRLTRDSSTVNYTVNKNRVLWENYDGAAIANFHAHSLGLTGSGVFIAMNGDTPELNAFAAIEVDHDTYETASITVTQGWFGQSRPGQTNGRDCPQMIMTAPGPNGVVLGANDTWASPILRIKDVASASEACVLDGPIYAQGDALPGTYYNGWDNLILTWYPEVGYTAGGFGNYNNCRHVSYDGENWAMMMGADLYDGPFLLTPKSIMCIRSSDEAIMIAPKPVVKTVKPLLINPGADNLLTSVAAPDIAVAPSSTNTLSAALWNGSRFVYNTGGADVSNAPSSPAPLLDPIYYVLGCESQSSYAHGIFYTQASGQTTNIGSGVIGVVCYVAPLGPKAIGSVTCNVGVAGATNDRNPERGFKPDHSKGHWTPMINFGDPANNPTAARGAMALNGGPGASLSNYECPMLVAVGGVYNGTSLVPYPTARLSTSNPMEIERIFLPSTTTKRWTTFITIIRPETDASVGTTPPSGTLATVWADSNNYVTIALDGPNFEIEFTPTVAGSGGTTTAIAIEEWMRGGSVIIAVTDDGVGLEYSVLNSRNGHQSSANASGTISAAPTEVRLSNAAMTAVYPMMYGAVDHRDEYLTAQQRQLILTDLSCVSSDAEIAAVEFANTVKAELATTLFNINADVLTRSTQVSVDAVPTVTEFEARSIVAANYATSSALASVAGTASSTLADTITLTGRLSSARAGYIDNLNVGGSVATASAVSVLSTDVANVPTVAEFEARTIAAANYATAAAVAAIDVTADVTVQNPQVNVEICD